MPQGRNLTVYLTSDVTRFGRGLRQAEGKLDGFRRRAGKAAAAVGAGLAAGVAAGVAVTVEAVKAAADDQAAQAKLARTMKNTTGATQAQIAAMEEYVAVAQKKTGMDDGQLRQGLEILMRYTKNAGRAQAISNVAQKISLNTGKDYLTVVKALARAEAGQTTALKKLGIPLGENVQNYGELATAQKNYEKAQADANRVLDEYGPKSKEYAKALEKVKDQAQKVAQIKGDGIKWLAELNDQFRGSIADDAKTYAGGLRRVGTAWDELVEAFGAGVAGGTDAPGMMSDLADSLYDAAPAAEEAGKALNGMMIAVLQNLPNFLLGLKALQLGIPSWVENVKAVPGNVADFLGLIPDGVMDPINKANADRDAQVMAELYDYWKGLQPASRPNPYAQYRPMATTQRTRDAATGADTRAAQRGAKTLGVP